MHVNCATSLQNKTIFLLISQSYECQKKKEKSAFNNSEVRCVCGAFTKRAVARLLFAFCYWVWIELFVGWRPGDKLTILLPIC